MTTALSDRCARTGGPRSTAPCLARSGPCLYCAFANAAARPPTREEPPREQRP